MTTVHGKTGEAVVAQILPAGPWPWYSMLALGISLGGGFPWLMTAWGLFKRRRTHAAAAVFLTTILLLVLTGGFLAQVPWSWWVVGSLVYGASCLSAMAAWVLQRRWWGGAPRRYRTAEWQSWAAPVLIGVLLGLSASILISVSASFQSRVELLSVATSLDRQPFVWDLFRHWLPGLLCGLLLGAWWAGEGRRFTIGHVLTFLCAFALTANVWTMMGLLSHLSFHGGDFAVSVPSMLNSPLIPPWIAGFKKFLLTVQTVDVSALVAVPLLFGAVSRVRDFWRRSLVIPLSFLAILPFAPGTVGWWKTGSTKTVYCMSHPDAGKRHRAHDSAAVMLRRFPEMHDWPRIAEAVARFRLERGNVKGAKVLHRELLDRCEGSNRWARVAERARAHLTPSQSESAGIIEVPAIDYEEYLTPNWMALLSVARFWEGPEVRESDLKIRLKDLSTSEEKIALNPLGGLADLDDAATALGYESFIVTAGLERVRRLIAGGFPVIYDDGGVFSVIHGEDSTRSSFLALNFSRISARLRNEKRREAREILDLTPEGTGGSEERIARVLIEARDEYPTVFWGKPEQQFAGPLMAVICPSGRKINVSAALGLSEEELRRESDSNLAALIAIAFIRHADPVQATAWSRRAVAIGNKPLPWLAANLARVQWESRGLRVKSRLPLEERLTHLSRVFAFFEDPATISFLKTAQERFEETRREGVLPGWVADTYVELLEKSDPAGMIAMREILGRSTELDPGNSERWRKLAELSEWAGDLENTAAALKGAASADPLDFQSKVRLARTLVLLGKEPEAHEVLGKIAPAKGKKDADWFFARGSVAEWEGDFTRALDLYEKAIDMVKYRPWYHLRYGRLLLSRGREDEARRALKWAARIDAGGAVRHEAENLLGSKEITDARG